MIEEIINMIHQINAYSDNLVIVARNIEQPKETRNALLVEEASKMGYNFSINCRIRKNEIRTS